MNEVRASSMYLKFFLKQSCHGTKDGDTPANKLDLLKNYCLEKLLLTSCKIL